MKRIFTLLLTLVMTFSLAIPAQAANNTKASTMRLMETEGTATVENAIGKKLSIQDKMRLYSGYEVSTEKASYAYISLDNSKAVKLDASSAVKVNQTGKKLELDVTAGELMFNVPVALKSDESLNIRTSTMVTGIRGTAGWVNALDRYTTRIGVLEGSVTIQSKDPFTGADRSVTIVGGQIATIIRHERANAIQQQLIDDGVIIEENIVAELTEPGQIVEEIQEADIPGFVAEEVSSNSNLQDRISEESPLNVNEIIEDADKRLDEEEKAAEKQDALIQKELKELDATDPGLPFAAPEVIVQTNTVIKEVPGEPTTVPSGLNHPETEEVQTVLDAAGVAAVTNPGSDFDITALQMDSSDVLYVIGGSLDISTPWTIEGTVSLIKTMVENTSSITVNGTLNVNQGTKLNNHGIIQINSNNSLHLSGILNNNHTINIGSDSISGLLEIEPSGVLNNIGQQNQQTLALDPQTLTGEGINLYEIGSLVNNGTFNNTNGSVTALIADAPVSFDPNIFDPDNFDPSSVVLPVILNNGTLNLDSGTIEVACFADGLVAAVYNTGTLNLSGGSITVTSIEDPGASNFTGWVVGVWHQEGNLISTASSVCIDACSSSTGIASALVIWVTGDSQVSFHDGFLRADAPWALMLSQVAPPSDTNIMALLTRSLQGNDPQLYLLKSLAGEYYSGCYTLQAQPYPVNFYSYLNSGAYYMELGLHPEE